MMGEAAHLNASPELSILIASFGAPFSNIPRRHLSRLLVTFCTINHWPIPESRNSRGTITVARRPL